MALKFLSMAEVSLVPKNAPKPVPVVTLNPSAFRDLLAQKTQEFQERRAQLIADGFESQSDLIQRKIDEDCTNEFAAACGFIKIKSRTDVLSSGIFSDSWQALKHGDGDTIASLVSLIVFTIASIWLLSTAHFAEPDSFPETICRVLGGISLFISAILVIAYFMNGNSAARRIENLPWDRVTKVFTDEQMRMIKLAKDLNMFTEISMIERFNDQNAIIGTRNGILYKIA